MSRYLLDTNILSNVTKPVPSKFLLAWMSEQCDENLFITSLTVGEIWRGILALPAGHKSDRLKTWFNGTEGPLALFKGRILAFDDLASIEWAKLMVEGAGRGRPRSPLDMILAAIAVRNDCIVVTDNERDFAGLNFINPLHG